MCLQSNICHPVFVSFFFQSHGFLCLRTFVCPQVTKFPYAFFQKLFNLGFCAWSSRDIRLPPSPQAGARLMVGAVATSSEPSRGQALGLQALKGCPRTWGGPVGLRRAPRRHDQTRISDNQRFQSKKLLK